jgi:predicted nucleic acid-binding protein
MKTIIKAKEVGLISAVRPLLESLENNNFHISTELVVEALRLARITEKPIHSSSPASNAIVL